MKVHELKTWHEYFEKVTTGEKSFEIRFNDRDYKVGDTLFLQEWDPPASAYTGRDTTVAVTYMTDYGQQPGCVVMGIKLCSSLDREEQLSQRIKELEDMNHKLVLTSGEGYQQLIAENDGLKWKVNAHDRVMDASNEHYREMVKPIRQLRPDQGNPGIGQIVDEFLKLQNTEIEKTADNERLSRLIAKLESDQKGLLHSLKLKRDLVAEQDKEIQTLQKEIAELKNRVMPNMTYEHLFEES